MSGPGRGLAGWAAYETERARRGRRAAVRRVLFLVACAILATAALVGLVVLLKGGPS